MMQRFKAALDKMGKEVHREISDLRGEMRREFDVVEQAMAEQREAMARQEQALIRQSHILDQGLARVDEAFRVHRENVGTVVFTFVEDLNSLKTDVRDLRSRVAVLEKRTPPAA